MILGTLLKDSFRASASLTPALSPREREREFSIAQSRCNEKISATTKSGQGFQLFFSSFTLPIFLAVTPTHARPLPDYACAKLDFAARAQVERREEPEPYRQVTTGRGPFRVSVEEGVRAAYGDGKALFALVKFERSAAKYFEADRSVVRDQFKHFGNSAPTLSYVESEFKGVEALQLQRPDTQYGKNPMAGMAALFVPNDRVVVTVQFENGSTRLHKSATEFAQLRDRFLAALATCLTQPVLNKP